MTAPTAAPSRLLQVQVHGRGSISTATRAVTATDPCDVDDGCTLVTWAEGGTTHADPRQVADGAVVVPWLSLPHERVARANAPVLGSLCSGYEGMSMGLRQAGWDFELGFVADPDPAAAKVLAHHHPDVPNLGDITAVNWDNAPRVDILTAGFPCQPFSAAGRRTGADDERHLWPVGVLPAITALRPAAVLLENVPGLLTIDRGRVFGQVLADLSDLGYTVRWTTVGACTVGVCHHRHRVFIAATLAGRAEPDGAMFGVPLGGVRKWPQAGHVAAGLMWSLPADVCQPAIGLPTPTARDATRGAGWGDQPGRPLSEVIAALLPTPTARDGVSGPGHAVSAEGAPDLRTTVTLLPTPTVADSRGSRNATAGRDADAEGDWSLGWSLSDVAHAERWGIYATAIARHEAVLGRQAPDPTKPGTKGQPRLAPAFVEWMMGLPAGHITAVPGISRNDMLRLLGNGVVPAQFAAALPALMGLMAAPIDVVRDVAA